ncbi:pH-response regulator protein palA/RIM20 [Neolecta irregularis DAH-3]|uniref:pH-response regulator protein palA/RIM20 n=1 Tax=Neolecta irregularis (strain DAH-3) TaxID=1198029 RepID=A0A1U7LMJ1_NEOID|nr:pH-response regulator protein palA/RIM20 [Neolecta irregularis DAH-3]|eukprot:OLL23762.1 pH-response regulator protein palA/RIM20 [Neolecta irregularis DAH-3]
MSNLLLLPLKQTLPISLSKPLLSYISQHYDASPKTFESDIQVLQDTRDSILNLSAHPFKLQNLLMYHTYLLGMLSKFPQDERPPGNITNQTDRD